MLAPLHLCMYMCVCAYLLCYLNGVIVRAAMRPTVKCEIDIHYGALACLKGNSLALVDTARRVLDRNGQYPTAKLPNPLGSLSKDTFEVVVTEVFTKI